MSDEAALPSRGLLNIDVIIPVRNGAATIGDILRSVLDQTVLPSRVIVVDDGSTDETVSIVRGFQSDRIEVLQVPPGGVSRARNIGIRESTADLIAFLDADDLWLPKKLEQQLRVLLQEPDVSVVYCGISLIDSDGADIANGTFVPFIKGDIFEDLLLYERPLYGSASSVMVYRHALDVVGGFDETLAFSEDVDLWVRLARHFRYGFAIEALVKIRINPNSATRLPSADRDKKMLLCQFRFLEKWVQEVDYPAETVEKEKKRILSSAIRGRWGIFDLLAFHKTVRNETPAFSAYLGRTAPAFLFSLFRVLFLLLRSFLPRLQFLQRLKLFLRHGTIFFRHVDLDGIQAPEQPDIKQRN